MSDSPYLTREEAAQRLRCTVQQVSIWIHAGKLRGSKPGKQWLIRAEDIDSFVDSQATRRRRRRAS